MANNMKLTKAELNSLLSKPLSKGALKKINMVSLLFKGASDFRLSQISTDKAVSLLNMIENTDFGVLDLDGTDYDQIDSLVEDLTILSGDDSEPEATEVSSSSDLDESIEVSEETKETKEESCTVGGVARNVDATPEFLRDKSDAEHEAIDWAINSVMELENSIRASNDKELCIKSDYSGSLDDGNVIVTNHQIRSCWLYNTVDGIATPHEFKTSGMQATTPTSSRSGGVRGHQKNSMRQYISEKMDRKASAVRTIINSAKNPLWNSLRTCICEMDGKLMFDDDSRVELEKAIFHKNHPFALAMDALDADETNLDKIIKDLVSADAIKPRYVEMYRERMSEWRTLSPATETPVELAA
jgi:hypothetical protein